MSSSLVEMFRAANLDLQECANEISRKVESPIVAREAMSLLGKIDRTLLHVSRGIEGVPQSSLEDPEITLEIELYRQKLKILKSKMEVLESRFRLEKIRLENAKGRMKIAGAWAEAMREIS